jgi:alpha-L-rhamnosidase
MVFVRLILLLLPSCAIAQTQPSPQLLTQKWTARWISAPGISGQEYGVYHFRKSFELPEKPDRFQVAVSADNRYKLYVNGQLASLGPARGDLLHWNYEFVDIAPWLRNGQNTLAAVVWNFGPLSPEAQITQQTAFILQGNTARERVADTGPDWQVTRNSAYTPLPFRPNTYYVAGPGDRIDAALYPWGWEQPGFDDSGWSAARPVGAGVPADHWFPWEYNWGLQPSPLPQMSREPVRIPRVRQSEGTNVPAGFPAQTTGLTIAPNSRVRLLLDQEYLTKGYFQCAFSGGRGAGIRIAYAEGFFDPKTGRKDNRNDIDGKPFIGLADSITADGGRNRVFETLWQRTWRYVEIRITTAAEALTLDDVHGIVSGYPFDRRATFDCDNPEYAKFLDIGWRTALGCADETYTDCPYYEQLQYTGDTRIQALVSLYNSGDDRLMRNAIVQTRQSLSADGILMSRYPTRSPQYIPPFALYWIGMVADFRQYRDDPAFVQEQLPAIRSVLSYFEKCLNADATLGHVPHWNFADWVPAWDAGIAPARADGHSAVLDLQLILALESAAPLEEDLGYAFLAQKYRELAAAMRKAVVQQYWDSGRGYFADTPDKTNFSQHANALAVLAGAVAPQEAAALMRRVMADTALSACTIYFKYYLHRAAIQAGLGNEYAEWLDEWRAQLGNGLTTWAESPEPCRSDCHAWGAHPNIEIFRTVLGVESDTPGFRSVRVAPHPGKLTRLRGTVPHPRGMIEVQGEKVAGKWGFNVSLPEGVLRSLCLGGENNGVEARA